VGLNAAMLAVLAFTMWTVALALFNALYRGVLVLLKKRSEGGFQIPPAEDEQDFTWRVTRAHMNCVENLPIFFALVWLGTNSRADQQGVALTAVAIFLLRIGQSVAHLASGRSWAIKVRYGFFVLQVVGYVALIALILRWL
jgi:uncharacterized MAPEG superfamily protein